MMDDRKKTFDVWFIKNNTVYKEVPYHVVADWAQQARLDADDMVKPTGAASWSSLGSQPLFEAYLPRPREQKVGDAAEALEPIELDFNWRRRPDDDDDDVDMIPLIDISLVLLIFFMMTTTVAGISRINVPTMENAVKIDPNRDILRVDIDMVSGMPVYGLGRGTAAPAEGDGDLRDESLLFERIDKMLSIYPQAPKVRIAAHGDLPYEVVEQVMKDLERLRQQASIHEYYIEVNERARR